MLRRNNLTQGVVSPTPGKESVREQDSGIAEINNSLVSLENQLDKDNLMSRRPTRLTLELLARVKVKEALP